jgi:2-methylcitrate dehydratase PrpD
MTSADARSSSACERISERREQVMERLTRRTLLGTAGALVAAPLALPHSSAKGARNAAGAARADHRSKTPALQTEAIARHAVKTPFEALDAATLAAVKLRVLDLIGCVLAGVHADGNRALAEMVAASGATPAASLIGYPVRGTLADVAMANAIFARSYDFEVMTAVIGTEAVASHHSPTTCMTALACAEQRRASGRDFLIALAVGDDIAARLLVASGLDFDQGWDGSPVYSALAAVAIAARFRGLSPRQTQDAMGIAVDQIGGTIQNIWDGATDFKLPQGTVARNAVLAVELAARGWTGMQDVLHAPFGFYAQYTAGCSQPQIISDGIGRIFHGEAYFKPYPACAAAHPAIDCARALRNRTALDPASIASVVVRLPTRLLDNFCAKPFEARRFPQADANFSFQFLVANTLLHGTVRQEHYAEATLRSSAIRALVDKVSLAPLDRTDIGLEIEVRTADGRLLRESHGPRADKHPLVSPSTRADVVAKFHQQVEFAGYIPAAQADEIVERVERLEQEADMAHFLALLTRSHVA